jgi:amino acid adenylation domain-containing protein
MGDSAASNTTGLEIAVIGMAGRFPGAKNIHEFWDNLKNGVESISFFSDEELEEAGVGPTLINHPTYVKARGVVDNAECFDASFFGYTPAEAKIMDPQVRIFHECAWEALEEAGYDPETYKGKIGIYAGASMNLFWQTLCVLSGATRALDAFSAYQLIDKDYLTTRISFKFNLRGPSFAVQTACSTSLVVIHLACQGLLSGECSMALAGGVTAPIPQKNGYIYQEGMVLSPNGHCRAFDAGANGFIDGNGVGVVVLKLLEDATTDGDYIHAVIKGSSINNDGSLKSGFTAPSIKAQAGVIKGALSMAEVESESISYVETHGTGTSLGDPIEIEALKRAFDTEKKGFCRIGSLKTNVGHLDAAAGVAGFIKTVMMLENRQIPPSLHFKTPNPEIDFKNSPFLVNTRLRKWENGKYPLRAGVSAFGIGGTNAHVVLEAWSIKHGAWRVKTSLPAKDYQLLLLSAKTKSALDKMTENLVNYLKNNPVNPTNPVLHLADVAYTMQVGRKPWKHRRMVVCASGDEAVAALSDFANVPYHLAVEDKQRVVFMFAGLGSQYVNMGLELYQKEPAFREEMDHCFEIMNNLVDYDIKEILYPPATGNRQPPAGSEEINQIDISQVVIFIIEYALARLLMKLGIKSHSMIGYSFGEYTAACLSGVFSLEDALKIIVTRGKLLVEVPAGTMLSVPLSRAELIPLLGSELSIAIDNGSSCIIAGPSASVAAFEQEMKKKKLMCMPVPHSTAMHSKMMEPILAQFEQALKKISLNPPQIPYISNLTGKWINAEEVVKPTYWSKHLRETVCFSDGLMELVKNPNSIFIEIGPGRDLSTMVKRFMDDKAEQKVLNLIRPPQKNVSDVYYLLNKIGYLWLYGVNIDWSAFYSNERRYRIPLPTYPFEQQRYDIDKRFYRLVHQMALGKVVPVDAERAPGIGIDKVDTSEISPVTVDAVKVETAALESETPLLQRSELSTPYIPPRNGLEKVVVDIWQRFFGVVPIGIQDDFFELGGDSLKAMHVSAMIQKELSVEIPVAEFFSRQTSEGLVDYIKENTGKRKNVSIEPVEKMEHYPVSSAQRRLYVLQQMGEENISYNEPVIAVLEGDPDKEKFEEAFKQLIKRHESLRTSFEIIDGETVQKIHPHDHVDFAAEYFYLDEIMEEPEFKHHEPGAAVNQIIENFIRPFDMGQAPLFRVGLIKIKEGPGGEFVLIVDMHHTITDGTSQNIILEDLMALYTGDDLPGLQIQYKDFSQWQNQLFQSGEMKKQEEFWLKEFETEPLVLNLPADYSRPAFLRFEGDLLIDAIGTGEIAALKKIALEQDATMYMVLLTAFNIFLSKLSGQEEIVCGTLIAGRRHVNIQRIVGMFVNTLVLRNFPTAEKTFIDFLKDIKKKTMDTFENQDFQFETLVDKVVRRRDTSRNPLFDVMFILQNLGAPEVEIPDLKTTPYSYETKISKFDLRLDCIEQNQGMSLRVEYSTHLFRQETIKRFMRYFKNVIRDVIENPFAKIGDMEIISQDEKEQLLYKFNETEAVYPEDKTLHELFEEQVTKEPHRIAAAGPSIGNGCHLFLTYKGLNQKTNQLAHLLRMKGVKQDRIVGVIVNRSIEMIEGILTILKAGGAYLPIDPNFPGDRIRFMLADSGSQILLTTRSLFQEAEKVRRCEGEKVFVESPIKVEEGGESGAKYRGKHRSNPGNLAYIIYTSGSTGRPKGVLVEHRSAVNILFTLNRLYPFANTDVFLLKTSYLFDVSVTELFGWFLEGGQLRILEHGGEKDPQQILDTIEKGAVTHINFVPSMFKAFLDLLNDSNIQKLYSLKYIFLAGESLGVELVNKYNKLGVEAPLVDLYGPTEATVYASGFSLSEWNGKEDIPIGKPLFNTKLYIMNTNGNIQPPDVPGELCISGIGIARGYLNRPELTAEKFKRNLFVPESRGGDLPVPYHLMYWTGDITRWQPDGNIEFLGRSDYQVKIRGYRVELREIESRLLTHSRIKEVAVIVSQEGDRVQFPVAYIVADGELCAAELREYLSRILPDYMIPAHFVQLEKMPLTPNGKVDRKSLHLLGKKLETGAEYVAPKSDKDILIADIWKDILQLDDVGIYDNFFDLGGTSVDIIRLNGRLREAFEKDIPIVIMYRYTTIGSFSQFLDSGELDKHPTHTRRDRADTIRRGKSDKMKMREKRVRRRHEQRA